MAAIENDHLVVNVVFTGPPLAGKTQSVKALMPQLKGRGAEQDVFSPGDWRGRTAFFDWAEYEGGAFDGKPIQCRIISTPGQVALSDRREMLLRSADAVILVIDSQADALERAVLCYEEMAPWLAESSRDVPVRVVLQCNKQDLPGSLSPEELTRRLPVPCGKDVYATSASTGKGLRAAFVAGVRNAVDRARALVARGLLEPPEFNSGEELFERMRRETAQIGSLRPSSPSAAPTLTTESSAPPRAARSRGDSARPGSARASNRAAASGSTSSGSARSPTSNEAPASGAGPFPFNASKPKSSSGFYPSMSARSSSAPPRASTSQPSLPPDHPFASNLPVKPTTRRSSGGANRRTPSTRTSSSVPGASRAVPRPKASESPEPSGGDEPARGRQSRHPATGTTASARRGAAVTDSTTTATRVRPSRADAGAKAPSTEVIAARSDGAATTTPALRADTRQGFGAFAPHATVETAGAHAPAVIESHRTSAASVLVPAVDAPGSAPPSSGTAPLPASSTRRALVPPYSEPRSVPEPNAVAPAGPHPKGWLDPAGEPARAWRPGEGERPAVMPASAYFAVSPPEVAPAEEAAARGDQPADAAETARADAANADSGRSADAHTGAERTDLALQTPVAPAQPAPPRATAETFAAGGARPAVMPASAYFAILAEREARTKATLSTNASTASPDAAPLSAASPSSSVAASAIAASSIAPSSAAPSALTLDEDPVDSGWPEAGEVLSISPAVSSPPAPPRAKAGRPAVMPASAWRALVERGELTAHGVSPPSQRAPDGEGAPANAPDAPAATAGDIAAGARAAAEPGALEEDESPRSPGAAPADASGTARPLRLLRGGIAEPRDDGRTPTPRPSLTLLERPAVMPASAWRALHESTAPHRGEGGDPSLDVRPANDAPTIAPSASYELLDRERQTMPVTAASEPEAHPPAAPPDLAQPAAVGLDSSRRLELVRRPGEESSESFRIPETPPGLQAFFAEARRSTAPPPAPVPSDEVIQSLPPSLEADIDAAARTTSNESRAPLEFPGPRMPGHARAPLAVWRRSWWSTLETHINSDATALEDARGRWIGELAPGWYARTLRSAPDARAARRAFAEEVLRERQLSQYLSRPRCVALTEEADRYWVWQAACRVPTLAAVLGRRLATRESTSALAEALLDASLAFVEARQRFVKARVPLPLSLHALSVQDDKLVYSGLLPDPGAVFVHPANDGHPAFEDALRKKWPGGAVDGSAIFAELSSKAAGRLPDPILAIIRSVVGQSSIETSSNEVSG